MEQIRNFGDGRWSTACSYCGNYTETRDHAPSRVLLDEPYPENLPVVPACKACNQGVSADEEYLACLIECVLAGSVDPAEVSRDKIRRILSVRFPLRARLAAARQVEDGTPHFSVEHERVRKVVVKLARGHALFELNEPQLDEPTFVNYGPLRSLGDNAQEASRRSSEVGFGGWPEVGSRAMQRLVRRDSPWISVQPGRYRYLTTWDSATVVQMVLSEYLACEVVWDHEFGDDGSSL